MSICIFLIMFIVGVFNKVFNNTVCLLLTIVFCFIDIVIFGVLLVSLMPQLSKNKKADMKINTCIIAIIMILLCICISMLLEGISVILSGEDNANLFSSASNTIMALLPSMLSLLGLHYSNLLNQQNAQEEKRLQNMPYIKIKYKKRNQNTIFSITNIANNICIPDNINTYKLDYNPILMNKEEDFIIDKGFFNGEEIKLVFKDIFENKYSISFVYNSEVQSEYVETSVPALLKDN